MSEGLDPHDILSVSLAFQSIAPGDYLEFDADCVFDEGRGKGHPYSRVLPFAAYPSSSSNALCSARTASRTCFSSIRHVIRISLVVISSMLIPASNSVLNIRPA